VKIHTQNEDIEGMVEWLEKYVGPINNTGSRIGMAGKGWACRYYVDPNDYAGYLFDITDEKLATLFALRWM
jgi:hypothetical protein